MRITLKPLAEQVVVITGASSGIGLVTARAAAAKGARVVLVSRNDAVLREVVAGIEAEGGIAAYAVADVGDPDQVDAAADVATARFGRIDTWVNVAGTTINAKLIDTPLDEHHQLFQTNYFGVVHGSQTAIRHLRERGGALITVGSIGSDLPTPILSAYSASKHAAKAYTQALRQELHADGVPISITLIKPAGIDTPIAQHSANHGAGEALLPPPVYDPSLVADAILHCATHVRRSITVGGAGRLQVLVGSAFPSLIDAVAPIMMRAMFDTTRRKTPTSNLYASPDGGRERSGVQRGRRFSIYTTAALHPGITAVVGAGVAGLTGWLLLRRRERARG